MRKPENPSHHTLAKLSCAVSIKIVDAFPSRLSLAGKKPKDWPDAGTTDFLAMVKLIKAGLAFYCIEDLLWPQGRQEAPIEIWVGNSWRKSTRHLHKLGEQGLPTLAELLWTPRMPNVQPVALRTYADAHTYRRAGALLERRFLPVLTPQWSVREHLLERAAVTPEFHQRFRFKELYYYGDYPSRVAESMEAEIRYILGRGRHEDDETRYGLYAPPEAKLKKAHGRQLRYLAEKWGSRDDKSSDAPSSNWVRNNLIDYLPGEEDVSGFVNDDFAKSYLKHLTKYIS